MIGAGLCLALALLVSSPPGGARAEPPLTIIFTADEMAHYLPHSPAHEEWGQGGLPRLATLIRQTKEQGPVLVVSGGSLPGSTPFADLSPAYHRQLLFQAGYDVILDDAGRIWAPQGRITPARDAALLSLGGMGVGVIAAGWLPDRPSALRSVLSSVTERRYWIESQGGNVAVVVALGSDQALAELTRSLHPGDVIIVRSETWGSRQVVSSRGVLLAPAVPRLEAAGVITWVPPATTAQDSQLPNGWEPRYVPLDRAIPGDPRVTSLTASALTVGRLAELDGWGYGDYFSPVATLDWPLVHAPGQRSLWSNLLVEAMRLGVEQLTNQPVHGAFILTDLIPGGLHPAGELALLYDVLWAARGASQPGSGLVSFYLTPRELYWLLEASLYAQRAWGAGELDVAGMELTYDPARSVFIPRSGARYALPWLRGIREVSLTPRYRPGSDPTLYHLASDIASLQELVRRTQAVPRLALLPRDRQGQVVEDVQQLVLYLPGEEEFTLWQAVWSFLAQQSRDSRGLPIIPPVYRQLCPSHREVRGSLPGAAPDYRVILSVVALLALLVGRFDRHLRGRW